MFTGLIEAVGRIERWTPRGAGGEIRVATALGAELQAGDSIAVNGVCLTAVAPDARGFSADVSPATLAATTMGHMRPGRRVNLERPVRADARMGGHFVLGHVDATGRIVTVRPDADYRWVEIEIPRSLDPYVVPKGSIAVDGISLTTAGVAGGRIGLQIVPFTLAHTALEDAREGDAVNLEADVLGKYVARLLGTGATATESNAPEPVRSRS